METNYSTNQSVDSRSVMSENEIWDGMNGDIEAMMYEEKSERAALLLMIAEVGIDDTGYHTELPDDFPYKNYFQPILSRMAYEWNFPEHQRLNEASKVVAKEIFERDFLGIRKEQDTVLQTKDTEVLPFGLRGNDDLPNVGQGVDRVEPCDNREKQVIPSVQEVLDGISKGSIDPLMFDEAQKTGIQLYLVAQHGIEVSSYLTELPDDYPYRDRFQPIVGQMAFEENYLELHRLNESSKTLAENILEKDFPSVFEELKSNRQAENSQENSYRWPENDDFLNENEQGLKM